MPAGADEGRTSLAAADRAGAARGGRPFMITSG